MRVEKRTPRSLIIVSLVAAFGLGILFGALATRIPRRSQPKPRVALAPGLSPDPEAVATLTSPPSLSAVRSEPDSVPGDGTATARDGYPIKGNGRSGIYHVPGGFAYDRTVASICFRSVEAAQAAGFRASKS
ncbi:MAG: hypothetical protein M3457_02500 [Chloroflexota bacterium]|nr:hypothetical protein [Chloroflexota bacterium]